MPSPNFARHRSTARSIKRSKRDSESIETNAGSARGGSAAQPSANDEPCADRQRHTRGTCSFSVPPETKTQGHVGAKHSSASKEKKRADGEKSERPFVSRVQPLNKACAASAIFLSISAAAFGAHAAAAARASRAKRTASSRAATAASQRRRVASASSSSRRGLFTPSRASAANTLRGAVSSKTSFERVSASARPIGISAS
mmetsp:Transcript_12503/g.53579  ORF Transcript_12503/g.53579 Transcript_12503/m.53579 type:complete len:201 (-) Transcript_12503:5309-5911(-)